MGASRGYSRWEDRSRCVTLPKTQLSATAWSLAIPPALKNVDKHSFPGRARFPKTCAASHVHPAHTPEHQALALLCLLPPPWSNSGRQSCGGRKYNCSIHSLVFLPPGSSQTLQGRKSLARPWKTKVTCVGDVGHGEGGAGMGRTLVAPETLKRGLHRISR